MKEKKPLWVVINQDVFPDANGRWYKDLTNDLGIKVFRKKKQAEEYVKGVQRNNPGEKLHVLPATFLRWE